MNSHLGQSATKNSRGAIDIGERKASIRLAFAPQPMRFDRHRTVLKLKWEWQLVNIISNEVRNLRWFIVCN
jgi:hypothetical protein